MFWLTQANKQNLLGEKIRTISLKTVTEMLEKRFKNFKKSQSAGAGTP